MANFLPKSFLANFLERSFFNPRALFFLLLIFELNISNAARGFGISDMVNLIELLIIVIMIYDIFKKSGMHTAAQIKTVTNSVSITAAEPKSFALFERS